MRTGEALLRAEIALGTCLRLLDFAARYDAMYDCYWNDTGWADRAFLERVRYYNADEEVVALLRRTRAPVDDLKAFLCENGQPVQKVQLCFRDMAERENRAVPSALADRFRTGKPSDHPPGRGSAAEARPLPHRHYNNAPAPGTPDLPSRYRSSNSHTSHHNARQSRAGAGRCRVRSPRAGALPRCAYPTLSHH